MFTVETLEEMSPCLNDASGGDKSGGANSFSFAHDDEAPPHRLLGDRRSSSGKSSNSGGKGYLLRSTGRFEHSSSYLDMLISSLGTEFTAIRYLLFYTKDNDVCY